MSRSKRSFTGAVSRIAGTAVIGLALALTPLTAHASTIYPPVDSCSTTSATAAAGAELAFSCTARTFSANEAVTITVTGENGREVAFAIARFAISTGSTVRTSDADGALAPVRITLPADASGVYNIAAISRSSAGAVASVSIVGSDGLPTTGGDSGQLVGVWVGGGALLLAGATVLIALAVRRRRDRDDL